MLTELFEVSASLFLDLREDKTISEELTSSIQTNRLRERWWVAGEAREEAAFQLEILPNHNTSAPLTSHWRDCEDVWMALSLEV